MEWRIITKTELIGLVDKDGIYTASISLFQRWRRTSKTAAKDLEALEKGIEGHLIRYYLEGAELQEFLEAWKASEYRSHLIKQVGLIHVKASNTDYIVENKKNGLFVRQADLSRESWSGLALELNNEWELAEFISQYEG